MWDRQSWGWMEPGVTENTGTDQNLQPRAVWVICGVRVDAFGLPAVKFSFSAAGCRHSWL